MDPDHIKSLKTAETLTEPHPPYYEQDYSLVDFHDKRILPAMQKKDQTRALHLLK